MKKKIKMTLIFIFTLLFILFIKSNCFAISVNTSYNIPEVIWDQFNTYIVKGEHGFCDSVYGSPIHTTDSYCTDYMVWYNPGDSYLFLFCEPGVLSASNSFKYINPTVPSNCYNYFWFWVKEDGSSVGHSTGGSSGYYYYSNNQTANVWYTYIIQSTFDLYDGNNNLLLAGSGGGFYDNTIVNPFIANTADNLSTGTFDTLLIMPGSLEYGSSLGFKINKINTIQADVNNDGSVEDYETYETIYKRQLDSTFEHVTTDEYWYEIPFNQLGINFSDGVSYVIQLVNDVNKIIYDDEYKLYDEIRFTIGGLTDEDKEANRNAALIASNEKTTEAVKENTETNKSILGKIGDILNFINPFSDKFFGKVLVDLILDGLKSLFVPSDDFFSNWLDDLNQYFSDVFGILYYPFDLLIDFLNRFSNIAGSDPIINIPEFKLEFMGFSAVLIKSFSYNFNDLLTNNTLKIIHNIYLTFVDIILWLGIVYLASNLMKHIIGSMSGEIIDDVAGSEQSYNNYKQAQQNKARYSQEQYEKDMSRYKK